MLLKPRPFLFPSVCCSLGASSSRVRLSWTHTAWCKCQWTHAALQHKDSVPHQRLPGSSPGAGSCRPTLWSNSRAAADVCAPACPGGAQQWLAKSHATFLPAQQQKPPPVLAVALDSQAHLNAGCVTTYSGRQAPPTRPEGGHNEWSG